MDELRELLRDKEKEPKGQKEEIEKGHESKPTLEPLKTEDKE